MERGRNGGTRADSIKPCAERRQHLIRELLSSQCLDVEKEAKDSGKEERSAIARCFVTTSKASRSQPSVVLLVVVE
ncbi:unnamed protein product [Strongylus vulgaris]|uniref:Uncharacterized protein n=1 Tax=Strongylus vulgaris TaxID=40348 RepID=A0A3P7LK83_STRVU|nr:unnamed protein product [Strongylus vulgaris]